MKQLLCRLSDMPFAALALGGAGLGALAVAFTAEHAFDIKPCILCLWERVPFAISIFLGFGAYFLRGRRCAVQLFFALIGVAFLVNTGLSFFHTGVEQHWWEGTDECRVQPLHGATTRDLREALLASTGVRCDEINFSIFGLTFANLNVLVSLVLALFSFVALKKTHSDTGACGPRCCCHKDV